MGCPNRWNFGYGKQMHYAAKQALQRSYRGHFATVAAHTARFKQFSDFAKQNFKIRDIRKITHEHLQKYAEQLKKDVKAGRLAVSTAQNRLSSVNQTMSVLREDKKIWVSPAQEIGKRDNVRTTAPRSLDREKVQQFSAQADPRARAVLGAARELGMREKEAVLMNWKQAAKEARETGKINVTEGTKGGRGRYIDRFVNVTPAAMRVIEQNAQLQGGRQNLIQPGETWKQADKKLHSDKTRALFRNNDLKAYHDARSAWACERYKEITGQVAPAVAGQRMATKEADTHARDVIARELGHARLDVCVAYIGSAR